MSITETIQPFFCCISDMRRFLFSVVYFLCLSVFFAQTLEETYAQIEAIPEEYQMVINSDFANLTDDQLFEYFIVLSGDYGRKDELTAFYKEKAAEADLLISESFTKNELKTNSDDVVYRLADFINQTTHTVFFKAYNRICFTTSELKDYKRYDCVSASIMYSILLTRNNVKFTPVETTDHVLVKVDLSDKSVDVETTNYYGFDPGTKKEFKANFSKTTGFTYVNAQKYHLRRDIDTKQMFSLVLQNRISLLTQRKKYMEAAQLAYMYKLMRGDEEGDKSYNSALYNLAGYLSAENNKKNEFEESLRWIEICPENQNKHALLNNVLLSIANHAEKTGDYKQGFENLELALKYGWTETTPEYVRFRRMLVNNSVAGLIKKQSFDEAHALIAAEREAKIVPAVDLNKMLKSVTTSECGLLYQDKNYEEAILKTAECLKLMPNDQVLINNLKVFFIDYVEELKTSDPEKAAQIIAEAKKRFPSDKAFLQMITD